MRIISLNLDAPDAAVVQRALARIVATCACQQADQPTCPECEALRAVVSELAGCGQQSPRVQDGRRGTRLDRAPAPPELATPFARTDAEPHLYILPEQRSDW